MIDSLMNISAAFGLSTSAGLNAYIPLLIVALTARFTKLIELQDPYHHLTSWWVIGILTVLLVIEMLVDKVPAVDSLNDMIQTLVRPAAGALLFAANANVINDIHPALAITAGLILAGGVHAAKGVTRPMVTASTAGMGNWFVSLMEDIVAFFVSILSLLLPLVMAVVILITIALFARWYVRRRRQKAGMALKT